MEEKSEILSEEAGVLLLETLKSIGFTTSCFPVLTLKTLSYVYMCLSAGVCAECACPYLLSCLRQATSAVHCICNIAVVLELLGILLF